MINLDIVPQSLFDYPPEYLRTFWVYIQKCDNTKAKEVVLTALQKALEKVPAPVVQP
jgi:hypothetical protein